MPNSPHKARTTSSYATNTPNIRTSPSTPTRSTSYWSAADRVILQFPFYWYSSPALLKEWEDEVITAGWAYGGGHALKGKELKLVVTTGSDAAKYRKDGEYSHTMEELLSPFEVVAYKIGMNYAEPFLVQGTATIGDAELDQAAADYVSAILD